MIDTLIFDFGDVFINLNKEKAYQKLQALGWQDFSEEMHLQNLKYEKGLISTAELICFYGQHFPDVAESELIETWNTIIGDFPKHRFEFIQDLAKSGQFKLILLSNTNELHIKHIAEKTPFFKDFIACFDQVYLSHEIGLRKPDSEIFRFVLKQHNLKAETCLFIDDLSENTESAQELGFKVWNLQPGKEDVVDIFTTHKNLMM